MPEFTQTLKKVMLEGRKEGARRFYMAGRRGDVKLRFLRMEGSDDLQEIYAPQSWYVFDADPGGCKKAALLEITMELICKASSTWLTCDGWREKAWPQRTCYFHNETKLCSSCDKRKRLKMSRLAEMETFRSRSNRSQQEGDQENRCKIQNQT